MKACTNENCRAYRKEIHPDNTNYCPICGQPIVKYGYQFVLEFLKSANVEYQEKENYYSLIVEDSFTFTLLKNNTNWVTIAITFEVECEDGSLSDGEWIRTCNEVNDECTFAKMIYNAENNMIGSYCTFYLDANVPKYVIGEMLKDTGKAMSLFIQIRN